jgi:hypothetical protein
VAVVRTVMTRVAVSLLTATAGWGLPMSTISAASAAPVASTAGSGWQSPINVGGTMDAVSCPGTRFCMAVTEDGQALSYDGSAWSTPVTIDPGQRLSSVSCPSRLFCVAVDLEGGNVVMFDGSTWSAPTQIEPPGANLFESVSCASPRLCVAGGSGGRAFVYDGSTWTQNGDALAGVSCTSVTFCMSVNEGAGSRIFDGSSWHGAGTTHDGIDTAVSCSSDRFCASVGRLSKANVWHRGSWGTSERIIHRGAGLFSVSCAGPKFCITSHGGSVLTYDGTGWGHVTKLPGGALSVSCPTPVFCAAVDGPYVTLYRG